MGSFASVASPRWSLLLSLLWDILSSLCREVLGDAHSSLLCRGVPILCMRVCVQSGKTSRGGGKRPTTRD